MGRMGLTENDLRTLAADVLIFQSVKRIVGSGLDSDRAAIAAEKALENQQITAEQARMDLAPFQEKVQPTDEEVKAYWETIQDSFVTEPRRKFTYVIISPLASATPEVVAALPENATPEQKDAFAKATAANAAKLADAKLQEQRKVETQVDDFLYQLEEKKGSSFEELAKKNGWETKSTDFFAASSAPQDLNVNLRASGSNGKVVDPLFHLTVTTDPFSKISEPMAIGEDQWLVARLDGEEKSRPKTFEEARDEARAQYITEKAGELLKTAAAEAAAKIKTSLAAGKSFKDAAAEAGITQVSELPIISRTYRPSAQEPQNLFQATRTIDPGSITEPLLEGNSAIIIYVAKREVVKAKDADAALESEIAATSRGNESLAFAAWLATQTEAANIQQLNRR